MSVRKRFAEIRTLAPELSPVAALDLAVLWEDEPVSKVKSDGSFIEPNDTFSPPVTALMDRPFGLNAVKNLEAEHYGRPLFDMQDFCFGQLGKTQEWLEACVCRR